MKQQNKREDPKAHLDINRAIICPYSNVVPLGIITISDKNSPHLAMGINSLRKSATEFDLLLAMPFTLIKRRVKFKVKFFS